MKITPPKGGVSATNDPASGSVGGDLGGSLPGPTVVGIGGIPIGDTPADDEILVYDLASNTINWEAQPVVTGFLEVINGGGGTVQAHGSMGAAETIDLANGNYHWGTLDANCTFTFTVTADTAERWFTLELIEGGAGGWSPTWPGSVVWLGGVTPTHDTTAGTTTIYVFFTRNGGTTWIGGELGGGSALTVEDEGTPLATAAETLDFVGAGVTASGTGAEKTITIPGTPTGSAGGDLSGTYPNPSVVDDSHSHTSATVSGQHILLADGHATPFTFNDLLQMDDGSDFMWSDPE